MTHSDALARIQRDAAELAWRLEEYRELLRAFCHVSGMGRTQAGFFLTGHGGLFTHIDSGRHMSIEKLVPALHRIVEFTPDSLSSFVDDV